MSSTSRGSRDVRRSGQGEVDELRPVIRALRSATLAAGSAAAYERAVELWDMYCREAPSHRHRSLGRRSGIRNLDLCVRRYLASLYQRGGGRRRQSAVATVYGLYYYYPDIRGRLARSQQLLRGWARRRPPVSHPPLTWPLVTLIAVTMALNGYTAGALATLVAFDGLLRISEVANLCVGDVSPPTDARRGRSAVSAGALSPSTLPSSHVILRLARTKTGSNQSVWLTHAAVERLLLLNVHGRDAGARVFQLTTPSHRASPTGAYRHALRVVCDALGLGSHHFTPHSLRHGGATHALLHLGQSIETIMQRGRWQSNSACRVYLQAGRARLLELSVAPSILSLADDIADDWYSTCRDAVLSSAPAVSSRRSRR
jgi:integrase